METKESEDGIKDNLIEDKPEGSEELGNDSQPFLFFVLGLSSLFSYYIFVNSIDIFKEISHAQNMGCYVSRAFCLTYNTLCIFFPFFNIKNPRITIIVCLVLLAIVLLCISLFALIDFNSQYFFTIIMISIGFCAMISSIISSCTSALVNYVSEQEKRNFYSGYVCCGIFAAGLRLFTKGSTKSESKVDSAAYFGIASCLYIIPIILFIVKLKIESVFNTFNRFVQGTPLSTSFLETFKLILIDFILTLVNSAITYSLFPGYLTKISTFPNIGNWIYVIITVLFCIFLFCGNQTANHFLFRRKPLRFLSLLRLSFYPLFIISIQNIIKFDPYWTVFWVIPFAFSDTYFENNIIYLAINENERLTVDKKSIANDILFLAKNCGAVVGVLLTFVLDLLG